MTPSLGLNTITTVTKLGRNAQNYSLTSLGGQMEVRI